MIYMQLWQVIKSSVDQCVVPNSKISPINVCMKKEYTAPGNPVRLQRELEKTMSEEIVV